MKKILALLLAVGLTTGLFAGCSSPTGGSSSSSQQSSSTPSNSSTSSSTSSSTAKLSGTVKISGSTSVESLAKALGEGFNIKNPDATVEVQGGGSGAAPKDVEAGVSDIGNLSRELKDEEKAQGFTEHVIAIDGIAIAVNPANKVEDLTIEQIAKIFTGEITNWKDVGGADAAIVVIGREAGSGTRDGFEEIVGVKEKCKYGSELNETGQVKAQVAATAGAVGYISEGYVDNTVKALKVEGVAPTKETIKDGSYKIQRNFLMITKAENDLTKAFIDYIMSDEGQQIVESKNFVKIK